MSRLYTEAEVRELIAPLLERIEKLEAEIARLKKDSSNSSKPPSSDMTQPPKDPPAHRKRGRPRKRRRGGQDGHAKHTREPFEPEQVDQAYEYTLTDAQGLEPLDDWRVIQQVELIDKPFIVTEHRARRYRDPKTGVIHTAPLPAEVTAGGLVGPRLSALIAYLKGQCHLSYRKVQTFMADVVGVPISTGQVNRVLRKATAALDPAYLQLQQALPAADRLGADETGHKDQGRSMWTWCFQNDLFAWFTIEPSRSSQVLFDVLGEDFRGIVHCDYFSAYRKYIADCDVTVQFCMAHLIRDIRYLTTLPDAVTRRYAQKLEALLRKLFKLWHRRGDMPEDRWKRKLHRARDELLKKAKRPPPRAEARNIADRFRQHGKRYFTFIDQSGVEPTNNATERDIRHAVIDRKITYGTCGVRGQRWCERIWTTLATCAKQQRSAFQFLCDTLTAHFQNHPTPSLLLQKV